jgi:SNF2 family DNA or RNA helicase
LAWTENDAATLTTYKTQYCIFGGFGGHEIVGYKNLDSLKDEISGCMIRRTLDQVRDSMPSKTVEVELVEMSDEHHKFYEAVVNGVKEEADKIKLNANNLLALTTRLRQATACPGILTTQDVESCKLERAVELAEELLDQGEKVVIMSTFKEPVYRLAKMLEQYKPLLGTGDLPDQVVQNNVAKFQNEIDSKLLICTHSKCGTGLTMNAASYMICIDTPWTDAQFSQSTDRIWRVTNTRPAYITVLACAGTIDERVWEIVNNKKDLSDYVVDGIDNSISNRFTDELAQIIAGL